MLISDAAMVSWLALQTVALIAQVAVTRSDISWIKGTLKDAGIANKDQQDRSDDKADKKASQQSVHDIASDMQDARLMERLDSLTKVVAETNAKITEGEKRLVEAFKEQRQVCQDQKAACAKLMSHIGDRVNGIKDR